MRVTVYQLGDRYLLTPESGSKAVELELGAGVELKEQQGGGGQLLAYRGGIYGQPIRTAIRLGWCTVVDP